VVDIMGVLNVTPDSFSDGGEHLDVDRAVDRASRMIAEGASVIDVGGESTRPGAEPIDPEEECRRVLPVLEAIADPARLAGVRLSVDTRNEVTARRAVALGASLINDVGATLWPVAAELSVGWVAMHMLGDPRTMQRAPSYDDVVDDVRRFLVSRASVAVEAGVPEVWVDPGIGFGKTTRHNVELLARLDELVGEGFDVLIGTSRKRFLGEQLAESDRAAASLGSGGGHPAAGPLEPVAVEDRLEGSLATATWAMVQGARMVRCHDVRATVQAATVVAGAFSVPPDGR
jgi:dihydropteroate synthase